MSVEPLSFTVIAQSLPRLTNIWFVVPSLPPATLNLSSTVSGTLLVALPEITGNQLLVETYVLLSLPKKSNAFVNFLVKKLSGEFPGSAGPPYSVTRNILDGIP